MLRRAGAVAAGLALAVIGVAAAAGPVAAQEPPEVVAPPSYLATFGDVCEGTVIILGTRSPAEASWSVTVDGELVWPTEGDELPDPSGPTVLQVGPGEVVVNVNGTELASHTWQEPAYCGSLPEPTATQPTCEAPGTITIPGLPDLKEVLRGLDTGTPAERAEPASELEAVPAAPESFALMWRLNGVDVAPESTHEVEPGTHVVSLHLSTPLPLGGAGGDTLTLRLQTWVFEIEAPDCPGDEGTGGELPKTGVPTVLIAVAAVALIALGGGLYLLSRRRRITFSA